MNQNFFLWYYTLGFRAAFLLYGNLLRYIEHRFHIFGHLKTLLSPWKRDVSFKDWRGLHPLKSLGRLFENCISRFMGMLVRSSVLLFAFAILFLAFFIGGIAVLLYLLAPMVTFLGLFLYFSSPLLGVGLFLAGILGGVLVFVGYLLRQKEEEETWDISELKQRRWFPRLLARLGVEKKELNKELLASQENFLQYLNQKGIDEKLYQEAVTLEYALAEKRDRERRFWSWENLRKSLPIGKGWCYAYTPRLDRFCLDLSQHDPTEYAHADLIGRQEELKIATVVLERPTQNSILLVGEPGIGKKTFIHYLARLIRENVFEHSSLGDARVLLFDLGMAVSVAKEESGDVDGYIRRLLSEATYAGNIILFIENIDVFLGGDEQHKSLAPVLSEFLALPSFRMIGTATTSRYHTLAKIDEQTLKFLETIYLRETTEEETLAVLVHHFAPYERKQTLFTIRSLMSIVTAAKKFNWGVPFPERAIDLAQEVFSYWKGTNEPFITPQTVSAFVTLKTGVPTGGISTDEKDKLLRLEELLHKRVIGQNEAVKQVAEAMRKARAGFGSDKRPMGSFIFLGPTGVGKTETVKAFAEAYFGSEERMIRLDMSEYQTPEAVVRLIGSQEMNVQGQLTNAAKENPFSILLLDEIEKAYPKALDIFLQILDEGYVTDGFGEKINFRNMIIIATSNAGAPLIKDLLEKGESMQNIRKPILDYIVEKNIFRLEFLNRFDGLIFFEPLRHDELLSVTALKLRDFAARLKKEKNIVITFENGVAEKIVEKGYEPEFGARSINRYIENAIEDVVVKQIIAGQVTEGATLSVSAADL